MQLCVDIGNSNIVLGAHDGAHWQHHWRLQTDVQRMPDEYFLLFKQLFDAHGFAFASIRQVVLSSVVPQLTHTIAQVLEQICKVPALLISPEVAGDLDIIPVEPGSDLIANAYAAYRKYQCNCLIVDFGTATTVMAVKSPGIFLGGSISAGLKTTLAALTEKTAQLPGIALEPPASVIGDNTIAAMQSGLVLGHIAMVDGLVSKMQTQLDNAKVIATGGLATLLHPHSNTIENIEPWLTLDGLSLLGKRALSCP